MSGLEEMIDAHRSLGRLDERTAEIAAPLLEQALKGTAAAGQSPAGGAWAPTKKGARAMAGAAKAIAVKAYGKIVRVALTGPEVFHHYGVRGEPRRPVIPDGGGAIPPVVAAVLDKASSKAFEELAAGGRR